MPSAYRNTLGYVYFETDWTERQVGEQCAAKCKEYGDHNFAKIVAEIGVMKELRHFNIVNLQDVVWISDVPLEEGQPQEWEYGKRGKVLLLINKALTTLQDYLVKRTQKGQYLTDEECKNLTWDPIQGIMQIHTVRVGHIGTCMPGMF